MGDIDLTGRVVIVTGASRGIGKGLALGLARLGASVVCAARSEVEVPGGLPGTIHDTEREIEAAEFGSDHDWRGWATPESVVAPVAALVAAAGSDFTGHVLDVGGDGQTWPVRVSQ